MTSVFRTRPTSKSSDGSGGKVQRKRRIAAVKTPYSRPALGASPTRASQNPSWITGLILPTSRLIGAGATKLLSVFASEATSSLSSSGSDTSSEDGLGDEIESCQIPFDGVDRVKQTDGTTSELVECTGKESQLIDRRSDTKCVIERLLMQESYSREECDRLVQIIKSRIVDESNLNEGEDARLCKMPSRTVGDDTPDLRSKAVMEAKHWLEEKKAASNSISDFDHGFCTLNPHLQLPVTKDDFGSPVDMAKLYMCARPPWASPLNHLESRTPSPKGSELSKQETPCSAAKRISTTGGSWNIHEEIRRVRSKATEDMLKTLTSTKIDLSFGLESKSIQKSLVADQTELGSQGALNDLNLLAGTKSMDERLELIAGVCNDVSPASVLEDGDLSLQPIAFPSAQDQDLEIIQTLEGEECSVSKSHHAVIPDLALECDSRLSHTTCYTAKNETELREQSIANGSAISGFSLPAGDAGQSLGPSDDRKLSPVNSSQDKLVDSIPPEETCKLSEASIEVSVLNEVTSHASGYQNSSSMHYEKSQSLTRVNLKRDLATKTTGVDKQLGRKLSRYNRKRRGNV